MATLSHPPPRRPNVRGCRASVTFDPPDVAGKCPFCGTSIVTQAKPAHPVLAPAGVIPFKVGRKALVQALRAWLAFSVRLAGLAGHVHSGPT